MISIFTTLYFALRASFFWFRAAPFLGFQPGSLALSGLRRPFFLAQGA